MLFKLFLRDKRNLGGVMWKNKANEYEHGCASGGAHIVLSQIVGHLFTDERQMTFSTPSSMANKSQ